MELPRGLVTFLLTDVEGSTALWHGDGDRARSVMEEVSSIIEGATRSHGGVMPIEQGEGDSAVAVFDRPDEAVAAALDVQLALVDAEWRVRIGLHTGLAEILDGGTYGGISIIRAARVRDLGRGGEVLLSQATSAVVAEALPDGASLLDLGPVELKGFDTSEPVHRLEHPDLVQLGDLPSVAASLLPSFPTTFIGRTSEQAALLNLIGDHQLVTITGAGGSGKTRLAHVIAEVVQRRGSAVAWLDLTAVVDAEQIAPRALEACGQLAPTATTPHEFLARHLSLHPTLLVIDNCEHLLDGVAELVDAVTMAKSDSRILTTSREPLGVAGETTWRIPSLSLPSGTALDELQSVESVALFAERARAASGFELEEANAAAVARICRRLDGIPLALELAAARTRSMSIDDLADRLDDRFALLTTGHRGAMERQRTLLASVQWSHDLLEEQERILLRRMSVFRAPFRLAAAEAVAGVDDFSPIEVLDGLSRLVDKSLVQHHAGRYSLLETIRAFAADRAGDAGELESLRDRHLDWALRRVERWGWPFRASASASVDEQIAETPDLRSALDWSWRRRPDAAKLLLPPLCLEWIETGNFAEAHRLVARAGDELGEGSPAWLAFVGVLAETAVPGGVIEWIEPAQTALAEHIDVDELVRARLEQAIAVLRLYTGDNGALADIRRTGAVCRAAGDEVGAFMALSHELFSRATTGHMREARAILDWIDAHGQPDGAWWAFDLARSIVAACAGDEVTARRHLEPLVATGKPIPCMTGAYHALQFGDLDLAKRIEAIISQRTLDGWYAEVIPVARAVVASLEEDWDRARNEFVSTTPMLADHHAFCATRAAELDLLLDDADAAAARLSSVRESFAGNEKLFEADAATSAVESLVALANGDDRRALERAVTALRDTTEIDLHIAVAACLQLLAVAHDACDPGNAHSARMLGSADAFADRVGCRWGGPVLADVAANLRERTDRAAYENGARVALLDAATDALSRFPVDSPPANGWDTLTPAEDRVVALVGEGLSNPEIAEQLYISVSTVKTHLVHAYRKLQIDSRAALAVAAATRE